MFLYQNAWNHFLLREGGSVTQSSISFFRTESYDLLLTNQGLRNRHVGCLPVVARPNALRGRECDPSFSIVQTYYQDPTVNCCKKDYHWNCVF